MIAVERSDARLNDRSWVLIWRAFALVRTSIPDGAKILLSLCRRGRRSSEGCSSYFRVLCDLPCVCASGGGAVELLGATRCGGIVGMYAYAGVQAVIRRVNGAGWAITYNFTFNRI